MKTHYRSGTDATFSGGWPTACNLQLLLPDVTDIKSRVTCGACRRTRYFKATRSEVQPGVPAKREP